MTRRTTETVGLSLTVAPGTKGVTLGTPSSATLSITDDDTELTAPSLTATRGSSRPLTSSRPGVPTTGQTGRV